MPRQQSSYQIRNLLILVLTCLLVSQLICKITHVSQAGRGEVRGLTAKDWRYLEPVPVFSQLL